MRGGTLATREGLTFAPPHPRQALFLQQFHFQLDEAKQSATFINRTDIPTTKRIDDNCINLLPRIK